MKFEIRIQYTLLKKSDLVKNTKTESVFCTYFLTFLCGGSGKMMNGSQP
jgi:hypothetical protein